MGMSCILQFRNSFQFCNPWSPDIDDPAMAGVIMEIICDI